MCRKEKQWINEFKNYCPPFEQKIRAHTFELADWLPFLWLTISIDRMP